MQRLKGVWEGLGGRLGLLLCLAGFAVIWAGWSGAAGYDRVPAQIPYLISGGLGGLGLVVVGAVLLVADAGRLDRAQLEETLQELLVTRDAVADAPAGDLGDHVVAGTASYHRPTCRLLRQRTGLERLAAAEAVDRGLSACRVCLPT